MILKHKPFLSLIFCISLSIRLLIFTLYLGNNNNFWQIDSHAYHEIGKNIAQGNGISKDRGEPNFHRLPLYPIFLAMNYKLFGYNKKIALAVQIFLASTIPILIFLLSLTLYPAQILAAKIAALASALHLGLILYSGFFMTESLFIFFFLMSCIFLFKNLQRPNNIRLPIASGLFLGIASMIRPVGQFLILAFIIIVLLAQAKIGEKILNIISIFSSWLIIVLPWLIRNYMLTGYIFFHTLPGGHFLNLSAARVAMHVYDCSYSAAREILAAELENNVKNEENLKNKKLSTIERCIVSEKLALKYFKQKPITAIKCSLMDIFRTTFSLYSAELLYIENNRQQIDYFEKNRTILSMIERYLFPNTKNLILKFIIFLEIFIFFLTMLGYGISLIQSLILKIKLGNNAEWPIAESINILIALFLIISLAGGYARMRLPAEPFILILSSLFWSRLKIKKTYEKSFANA